MATELMNAEQEKIKNDNSGKMQLYLGLLALGLTIMQIFDNGMIGRIIGDTATSEKSWLKYLEIKIFISFCNCCRTFHLLQYHQMERYALEQELLMWAKS